MLLSSVQGWCCLCYGVARLGCLFCYFPIKVIQTYSSISDDLASPLAPWHRRCSDCYHRVIGNCCCSRRVYVCISCCTYHSWKHYYCRKGEQAKNCPPIYMITAGITHVCPLHLVACMLSSLAPWRFPFSSPSYKWMWWKWMCLMSFCWPPLCPVVLCGEPVTPTLAPSISVGWHCSLHIPRTMSGRRLREAVKSVSCQKRVFLRMHCTWNSTFLDPSDLSLILSQLVSSRALLLMVPSLSLCMHLLIIQEKWTSSPKEANWLDCNPLR